MTNVGLDKLGFGAEATKFGLKGFAFHLPAAGNHDPSAVPRAIPLERFKKVLFSTVLR